MIITLNWSLKASGIRQSKGREVTWFSADVWASRRGRRGAGVLGLFDHTGGSGAGRDASASDGVSINPDHRTTVFTQRVFMSSISLIFTWCAAHSRSRLMMACSRASSPPFTAGLGRGNLWPLTPGWEVTAPPLLNNHKRHTNCLKTDRKI